MDFTGIVNFHSHDLIPIFKFDLIAFIGPFLLVINNFVQIIDNGPIGKSFSNSVSDRSWQFSIPKPLKGSDDFTFWVVSSYYFSFRNIERNIVNAIIILIKIRILYVIGSCFSFQHLDASLESFAIRYL